MLAAIATNIPWWMTVAMVCVWLAAVAGIFVVARSRQRLARSRRPTVLDRRSGSDDREADERGLPERTDAVRELGPG